MGKNADTAKKSMYQSFQCFPLNCHIVQLDKIAQTIVLSGIFFKMS